MTNTKDIIIQLKAIREEKQLSYGDILELMEKNGDFISKSTLSRVFSEGSENVSFKYEETLRPIANALLDMENIEDTDNMDVRGLKSFLKFKLEMIEDLEQQKEKLEVALDKEKIKYHEKLEKERNQYNQRIEFLMKQIELKDNRIDQLFEAVFEKDRQHKEMLAKLLKCHYCPNSGE